MAMFRDDAGREWTIRLDVRLARELRARAKYDIFGKPEGLAAVIDNPESLVDALWVACESRARELGVTPEEFAAGLAGDTIDAATSALLEAVVDFFPQRRRAVLRAVLRQTEAALDLAMEHAREAVEKTSAEATLAAAGNSFTSSPASSESTQDR